MKKLILFICLFFTISSVDGKTIYWLIFIDTTTNVGEIDKLGHDVLHNHFVNEVNAALAPLGYSSKIFDYNGNRTNPENCKAIVETIQAESDDIIVFYYIGHGGRPDIKDVEYLKKNPWPQMCMAQKDETKFIPLDWVNSQLNSKGARLTITIGMCCNSLSNISAKKAPSFAPNYGATYMSGNKLKQIQNLFLNYKGNLLTTSASPTQTSGCLSSDYGVVDAYTTILCQIFDKGLDGEKLVTWRDFLTTLGKEVDYWMEGEQTPIYDDSRLVAANAPAPSQPQKPEVTPVPQPTPKQDNGWKNKLTDYFDALISPSLSFDDRRELEMKLGQMFAPNALVRMMSQDSDFVVDKESAPVFLGRLATSSLLLKVVIVDGVFDNNEKITSLRVKEIYKQH
jgi:hypothetical protein